MACRFRSFIFMDCETTGLESWSKITELCLIAIQTEHLLTTVSNRLPRAINKLTLCFNPRKTIHPTASQLTGLFNETLENAAAFNEKTIELLENFIQHIPQPVCLVAHNGYKFDFPILRNHLKEKQFLDTFRNLFTLDTLQLFKHHHKLEVEKIQLKKEEELKNLPIDLLDDDWDDVISAKLDQLDSDAEFIKRSLMVKEVNETTPTKKDKLHDVHGDDDLYAQPTQKEIHRGAKKKLNFGKKMPSFKLGDVFERMTGESIMQSHEAECDVIMMAKCAIAMGEEFVALAEAIAVPFVNNA